MKLKWNKCKKSGLLRADGEFNCYWITDGAWPSLEVVEPRKNGPVVTPAEPFFSVELAKQRADVIENGE